MPRSDSDTPWKEALDHEFRSCLRLLFLRTDGYIDWTSDYESLDTELRKIWPDDELGKRLADKLVKVQNLAGDARYLHFEVQGKPQDDFPNRMYTYNHLGRGRFKQPVSSLAILVDDDPDWRPTEYVEETEESSVVFRFKTVKLLDWVGREAELDAHPEPFALIVRAHLGARHTRRPGRPPGPEVAVGAAVVPALRRGNRSPPLVSLS